MPAVCTDGSTDSVPFREEVTRWDVESIRAAHARLVAKRPVLQALEADTRVLAAASVDDNGHVTPKHRQSGKPAPAATVSLREGTAGTGAHGDGQPVGGTVGGHALVDVRRAYCINRREFWEIFTDYTVIHPVDHAFLCLPMSYFGLFASAEDPSMVSGSRAGVLLEECASPDRASARFLFHAWMNGWNGMEWGCDACPVVLVLWCLSHDPGVNGLPTRFLPCKCLQCSHSCAPAHRSTKCGCCSTCFAGEGPTWAVYVDHQTPFKQACQRRTIVSAAPTRRRPAFRHMHSQSCLREPAAWWTLLRAVCLGNVVQVEIEALVDTVSSAFANFGVTAKPLSAAEVTSIANALFER